MPRARWKEILDASRAEALLAIDLYNQPARERSLEAFYVHIHLAWLYLLHASFARDGVDYRYRKPSGRFVRIDGEPKTWDLAKSVEEFWSDERHPIRLNLEFTIGLRNKIEHRHQGPIAHLTAGHAQACIVNYETMITAQFGNEWSLADSLRFPLFVGTFTQDQTSATVALRSEVPGRTQHFIEAFQSGLPDNIRDDQRFEFRLNLIPKKSSKAQADMAISFVRSDDLSDEELQVMEAAGRLGTGIVIEKLKPVANLDTMKAKDATDKIANSIPFEFNMDHFIRSYRNLKIRPGPRARNPERTNDQYCIYDHRHNDYGYTQAWVDRLIELCGTEEGFKQVTGRSPVRK